MRELDTALICQTVADMVVQANCCIGADVMESLRQGRDREEKPLARSILDKLIPVSYTHLTLPTNSLV